MWPSGWGLPSVHFPPLLSGPLSYFLLPILHPISCTPFLFVSFPLSFPTVEWSPNPARGLNNGVSYQCRVWGTASTTTAFLVTFWAQDTSASDGNYIESFSAQNAVAEAAANHSPSLDPSEQQALGSRYCYTRGVISPKHYGQSLWYGGLGYHKWLAQRSSPPTRDQGCYCRENLEKFTYKSQHFSTHWQQTTLFTPIPPWF